MSNVVKAAIMGQHAAYRQDQTERGTAIAFGLVADPAGAWGLAVVDAPSERDVRTPPTGRIAGTAIRPPASTCSTTCWRRGPGAVPI